MVYFIMRSMIEHVFSKSLRRRRRRATRVMAMVMSTPAAEAQVARTVGMIFIDCRKESMWKVCTKLTMTPVSWPDANIRSVPATLMLLLLTWRLDEQCNLPREVFRTYASKHGKWKVAGLGRLRTRQWATWLSVAYRRMIYQPNKFWVWEEPLPSEYLKLSHISDVCDEVSIQCL